MRNNMEKGRIISTSKILCQMQNKAEIVLISTLLDEFDLKAFGKFCCVDLQGYVRDGSDFGKKRAFDSEELEKFDVVKVTKYEVQYIPKDRVKRLKTLVITDGEKGFEVIQEGNRQKFTIKKIDAPDTIGSGDTFFAAFCVEYYRTNDITKSAEFANCVTREFLLEKSS